MFVGKVAQTVAIDFLRAHRAGEALPEELPDPAPDPEQVLGDEQRRRRLLSALERVSGEAENPARDRDILRLHYQEGYSAAEIAEMGIGLSARGVEAVLRRAKARIEELLRES